MSSALSAPSVRGDLPQAVFTDFSTLDALRSGADGSGETDGGQLKEAARQFSSIFLHMALKSMRDASMGEGILDSKQSEFYRDMFDQQLALDLSEGDGFGLTDLIVEQLSPPGEPATPPIPALNAVQAYSQVANATQTVQELSTSADSKSNGQVPGRLNGDDPSSRSGSNDTTHVALP